MTFCLFYLTADIGEIVNLQRVKREPTDLDLAESGGACRRAQSSEGIGVRPPVPLNNHESESRIVNHECVNGELARDKRRRANLEGVALAFALASVTS